eukprot:CAMPEP_0196658500 /NCGR_PEP_ID=MMETSP1086-20130531/29970_2 /TAXON_ID=77921 /ORGANISM="Cyanoptyche  gloeocystis , Strain SAG4.97" /LENGTH=71 /DNA_ID=CAMNT_0041992105 /DNA_START=300 /DNA_END=515 /DNA_ORIENTATION=-
MGGGGGGAQAEYMQRKRGECVEVHTAGFGPAAKSKQRCWLVTGLGQGIDAGTAAGCCQTTWTPQSRAADQR